jgi:endonuclease/exonuclease/phosphatase family metal-dependent hydrolase
MNLGVYQTSRGVRRRSLAGVFAGAVAAFCCVFLMAQPSIAQTAFNGSAWAIPGAFQAEDFDNGGAGVAYKDNTPGNVGVGYRATDVDIAATASGYAVGWIAGGEWLNYTVNVTASGNYRIVTRVASAGTGGTFHIEFNGVDKTGPLTVPNTGGWYTYRDLPVVVSLSAGVQRMRVVFDQSSSSTGAVGNLSFFSLTKTTETATSGSTSAPTGSATPFTGSPWAIPGGIQAEDFDNGGQGVGYKDNTAGNAGGVYRQTDVDIAGTSSGGYAVAWTSAGEWLKYSVNVASAGTYKVVVRAASLGTGGTFHIEFGGVNKTGALRIPNTGGWYTYTDVVANVSLSSGAQAMRIVFDSNATSGGVGNISFVSFTKTTTTTSPTPSPTPPPSGSGGGKIRIMTWNIHFGKNASGVLNLDGQAKVMADSGADVIVLQEVYQGDQATKFPQLLQQRTGRTWYSHWTPSSTTSSTGQGLLTLSRLPLAAKNKMNYEGTVFSRVQVSVGGVPVSILGVHLEYTDKAKRTRQLNAMMTWARNFAGHPRVVGGDFNSWWGESWIATMEKEYTDTWQDVTGSDQNGYTLNNAVRFDYLFRALDSNWRLQPTSCWVPATSLSDHRPVVAEYTVK